LETKYHSELIFLETYMQNNTSDLVIQILENIPQYVNAQTHISRDFLIFIINFLANINLNLEKEIIKLDNAYMLLDSIEWLLKRLVEAIHTYAGITEEILEKKHPELSPFIYRDPQRVTEAIKECIERLDRGEAGIEKCTEYLSLLSEGIGTIYRESQDPLDLKQGQATLVSLVYTFSAIFPGETHKDTKKSKRVRQEVKKYLQEINNKLREFIIEIKEDEEYSVLHRIVEKSTSSKERPQRKEIISEIINKFNLTNLPFYTERFLVFEINLEVPIETLYNCINREKLIEYLDEVYRSSPLKELMNEYLRLMSEYREGEHTNEIENLINDINEEVEYYSRRITRYPEESNTFGEAINFQKLEKLVNDATDALAEIIMALPRVYIDGVFYNISGETLKVIGE